MHRSRWLLAALASAGCGEPFEPGDPGIDGGTTTSATAAGTGPGGTSGGEGGATSGSAGPGGAAVGGAGGNAGRAGASGSAGASGASTGGSGGAPIDAAVDAARGKPIGVTLGVPMPTAQPGGMSSGGDQFSETCPTNQVLIGFSGTTGSAHPYADSIEGFCATISISGNSPYLITTARAGMLTRQGDLETVVQDRLCPARQVIVGFDWRTGMYVDQLTFRCAPLTIDNDGASFKLSIGAAAPLSPIGGNAGTVSGQTNCPDGQIAIGNVGRAGQLVDAFGLLCATPSLVLAAP